MADVALRPLSAASRAGALRASVRAARAAAVLSLAAAWIHVAFVESHWREWWAYGAFFLACGVGQAVFVPLVLRWPRTSVVMAGIAGNLAIVGMYVLSRTRGIPFGPHARVVEKAGAVDLTCTAIEVVLVGVLLVMVGRGARRLVVNGLLLAGVALWVLRMTNHLP